MGLRAAFPAERDGWKVARAVPVPSAPLALPIGTTGASWHVHTAVVCSQSTRAPCGSSLKAILVTRVCLMLSCSSCIPSWVLGTSHLGREGCHRSHRAYSDRRRQLSRWCCLLSRTDWLIRLQGAGAAGAQVVSSRTVIPGRLLQPQHHAIKPKVQSSLAHPSLPSAAAAPEAGSRVGAAVPRKGFQSDHYF